MGDLLATADNHRFIGTFYHALQKVTILDPTCGSGAFLFAAMNILEPLYETCIDRMMEWNSQNPNLFKDEIGEIKNRYRSNIQYFIYKSIILRNLYGVDIMQEATEIAKLRLFLKMVAVVEVDRRVPNLGLDPLPDIDFNVRCGNTLVGYATEDEIIKDACFADLFTQQEFREKVETEMEKVSKAYDIFRTQQLADHDDLESVKAAKTELKERLLKLTDLLDHQLFSSSGGTSFEAWKESHQPFHWIAEYYQIIQGNGGFDVIIGNPPYVEYNKKDKVTGKSVSDIYKLNNYATLECGDLYAFCVERSVLNLLKKHGKIGMIVPISISSTDGYKSLRTLLDKNLPGIYMSNFGVRPAKLFDGVDKRLTIIISSNDKKYYSTKYYRWLTLERIFLFQSILYSEVELDKLNISGVPKISIGHELDILNKIQKNKRTLNYYVVKRLSYALKFTRKLQYFIQFFIDSPIIYNNKKEIVEPTELKKLGFETSQNRDISISVLNSSLFFWFFIVFSDCRNVNMREILCFPFDLPKFRSILV